MAATRPDRGWRDDDRPGGPGGRFRLHRWSDAIGRRRIRARAVARRTLRNAAAADRIGQPEPPPRRGLCDSVPDECRDNGPDGLWPGRTANPPRTFRPG